MLEDTASCRLEAAAGRPSVLSTAILFFLILTIPQAGKTHPLDEVMLEAYNAQAPKTMDVGVMRVKPGLYKVGIFLDLASLFDSVYVPERLKSKAGYSNEHPAWAELLRVARRHACLLAGFYEDGKRLPCKAVFTDIAKVGKLNDKRRDFVEMDYSVGAESNLAVAVNRSVPKGRLGFMDGPRSKKVDFGDGQAYVIALRGRVGEGLDSEPQRLAEQLSEGDGALTAFLRYIGQGFVHIIPAGLDHILFIVGLFLLAVRWKPLLIQVSLFTVAHTITLGLASMQLITLPPAVVEPLIAFSIVWVGIENFRRDNLTRTRMGIVFGFGLLHGLGFAGVLGDLGLPDDAFLVSLLGFNIGVELGQLAVVGIAFGLVAFIRNRTWYRARVVRPVSLGIALMGFIWGVERLIG